MNDLQDIKVTDNHLGYIKTYSGISINLRVPLPENINLADIASGLSKICRFGGQLGEFYSVAQHSVFVAHLAPQRLKKRALLHDATEAYLGDVVKPLKNLLGDVYTNLERLFAECIDERFDLSPLTPEDKAEIKKYDIMALHVEDQAFRKENPDLLRYLLRKADLLCSRSQIGWPPYIGETIFKDHFKKICNQ